MNRLEDLTPTPDTAELLLEARPDTYVAISELPEVSMPVCSAPLAAKESFARKLGDTLRDDNDLLPDPDMLRGKAFRVVGLGDESKITTVDRVLPTTRRSGDTQQTALCIQAIGSLLHDEVCGEDDRKQVLSAFVASIVSLVIEDPTKNRATFDAFTAVHLLGQGFDLREQLYV